MLKHLLITAMAAILTAGMGNAIQSAAKVTTPLTRTNPTSGRQMYANYCASCHGANGKGQGPVAIALKTQPTDLTVLSLNHGGKYPGRHVVTVLQFGTTLPAHGTADMPVWGPFLGKMSMPNSQERMLRICNLSHYLETLQVK